MYYIFFLLYIVYCETSLLVDSKNTLIIILHSQPFTACVPVQHHAPVFLSGVNQRPFYCRFYKNLKNLNYLLKNPAPHTPIVSPTEAPGEHNHKLSVFTTHVDELLKLPGPQHFFKGKDLVHCSMSRSKASHQPFPIELLVVWPLPLSNLSWKTPPRAQCPIQLTGSLVLKPLPTVRW